MRDHGRQARDSWYIVRHAGVVCTFPVEREWCMTQEDGPAGSPILNIVGEKVALGPLLRQHLPLNARWLNDFEVLSTTSALRPMTPDQLEAEYERGISAKDQVHFTIYERATQRPIGGANLHDV